MSTRTFSIKKGARIGTDGSLNLGAGACDHLPVGDGGGYEYRSLIWFNYNWPSDGSDITDAKLHIRNTSTYHLLRGSSSGTRTCRLQRVTDTWNSGSSSHPMTTSNSVVWPGPSKTTAAEVTFAAEAGDNDWNEIDILDILQRHGPAGVTFAGTPGGEFDNFGFMLIPDGSNDTAEFWSDDKSGSEPYITITYTTNERPTFVPGTPAGGGTIDLLYGAEEITITGTLDDPEGDDILSVMCWVGSTKTVSGTGVQPIIQTSGVTGISGTSFSRTYDISGFNGVDDPWFEEGMQLWYQMRCRDAGGWGSWTSPRYLTVHIEAVSDPVIVGTASTVMEMTVEGTSTTPQAVLRWDYSDPNDLPQSRFIARLKDSGGSTTYETIDSTTTDNFVVFSYTGLSHGTTYTFEVSTFNSNGEQSNFVSQQRVAKWATTFEYYNVGSVTQWSTETDTTQTAKSRVVVQHGSSSGSGTTPTNWNTNLGAIGLNTYYWARYWLFAWDGEATSSPSMNLHTITYTSSVITPDGWTLTNGAAVDTSDYWYGTRSLKMPASGSTPTARSMDIVLKVGETYVLSARVRSVGNSGARLRVRRKVAGTYLAGTDDSGGTGLIAGTTDGFVEVQTPPFVADTETVQIDLVIANTASTIAWFDALKLEVGTVVTPWTPSVLGRAVIVDGNGIQVDGRGGGIFRLRGTDAAVTNSEVSVGDEGIQLDSPLTAKEISAPGTPDSGYHRLYFKSDGLLWSKNSAGTERQESPVGAIGRLPFVFPIGTAASDASSNTGSLVAVTASKGGIVLIPFLVPAPLYIQSLTIRSADSANLRTAEWAVYYDDGTATMTRVSGTDGTFSFTPGAASDRTSDVSSPGTLVAPGMYWVVIRNTSTSQTFGIRRLAVTEPASNLFLTDNVPNATSLGSTLNTGGLTLSGAAFVYQCRLNGRVLGMSSSI